MNSLSLKEIQEKREENIVETRSLISQLLWVEISEISEDFIWKFEQIRADIISKIPWEVQKHKKAQDKHKTKNAITQPTVKHKWKYVSVPTSSKYTDPRVASISRQQQNHYMQLALRAGLTSPTNVIPVDVAIRSAQILQARALKVLSDGDEGKLQWTTQEDRLRMQERARMDHKHNFLHKRNRK